MYSQLKRFVSQITYFSPHSIPICGTQLSNGRWIANHRNNAHLDCIQLMVLQTLVSSIMKIWNYSPGHTNRSIINSPSYIVPQSILLLTNPANRNRVNYSQRGIQLQKYHYFCNKAWEQCKLLSLAFGLIFEKAREKTLCLTN